MSKERALRARAERGVQGSRPARSVAQPGHVVECRLGFPRWGKRPHLCSPFIYTNQNPSAERAPCWLLGGMRRRWSAQGVHYPASFTQQSHNVPFLPMCLRTTVDSKGVWGAMWAHRRDCSHLGGGVVGGGDTETQRGVPLEREQWEPVWARPSSLRSLSYGNRERT